MQIGFDFGGSLIKMSLSFTDHERFAKLLSPVQGRVTHKFSHGFREYVNVLFTREEYGDFIAFIRYLHPYLNQPFAVCTGGGVCDKREQLQKALGDIEIEPLSEFKSIVEGIGYFASIIPDFIYTLDSDFKKVTLDLQKLHPFLLANIGTGVSINRVNCDGSIYLCGTSMGGTSLVGFARLFGYNTTFEDLLKDLESLNSQPEEEWIYETLYESLMDDQPTPSLVPSIFQGIITNICYIAYLAAKEHKIGYVMFVGNFMKGNMLATKQIHAELSKLSSSWGFTVLVS